MLGILRERARAGVDVRVIGKVGSGGKELRVAALPIRLHVRAILADDRELFVGSQSLRVLELDRRREVGMIVRDRRLVRRFREIFEADWATTAAGLAESEIEADVA